MFRMEHRVGKFRHTVVDFETQYYYAVLTTNFTQYLYIIANKGKTNIILEKLASSLFMLKHTIGSFCEQKSPKFEYNFYY